MQSALRWRSGVSAHCLKHTRRMMTEKQGRPLKPNIQEYRSAAGNLTRAFGLIWRAHPGSTAGMAAVTLVSAVLPAAQAYAGKLIVDGVVQTIGKAPANDLWVAIQPLLPFLFLEFFIVTLSAIMSQTRALLEHVLHAKLAHTINSAIIRKSLSLDLHFFENAELLRQAGERTARGRPPRPRYFEQRLHGVAECHHAGVVRGVAVCLQPTGSRCCSWARPFRSFLAQNNFSRLNFRLLTWRAPEAGA